MPMGQPKMGWSWWRDLTECGPPEKGMANHFSILALRTPWTVWKGKHVCCGFVIYSFYYFEVYSFYSCFLESFYHEWMLNFVKGFLCINWDNYMVFIFQFVNITLIDLWILKNPCIPGIKPTWSWCIIFLMCCWILIARILLRIFAFMFISDIGL